MGETSVNPIRSAGVVSFLEWLSETHREVRSLRSLSPNEFLDLAKAYEKSNDRVIDQNHKLYKKWKETQEVFAECSSDDEAVERLKVLVG
jgi:beta-lactamase class D